jgi:hypothetical protein
LMEDFFRWLAGRVGYVIKPYCLASREESGRRRNAKRLGNAGAPIMGFAVAIRSSCAGGVCPAANVGHPKAKS